MSVKLDAYLAGDVTIDEVDEIRYLIVNNGVFSVGDVVLYDMGKAFSIGGILAFITYSKLFTSPMSTLAQIANTIQSCMASAERVFKLFAVFPF